MSNAHLFPAQAQAVADAYNVIQQPNHISQHHLWLSGEMGVGKTYIASGFGQKINAKRVLIVSPDTVTTKWQKVYQSFNPNIKIHIYQSVKDKKIDMITEPQIIIVKHKDLFKFFKSQYDILHHMKNYIETDFLNDHRDRIKDFFNQYTRCPDDLSQNNFIRKKLPKLNFDLIIFDEIHTVKPTTQEYAALAYLCNNESCPILCLTGTMFNQNHEYLETMLWDINRKVMESVDYGRFFSIQNYINNPAWFYTNILKYISVQISLANVDNLHKQDDITQEIMPLHGINLSNEQQAWIQITKAQLNSLNRNDKYQNKIITTYLDFPSQDQPVIQQTFSAKNELSHYKKLKPRMIQKKFVSMQLTPTKLKDTPKFKQLQGILKKYPNKTLVFVEDKNLIKPLVNNLPNAKSLPNGLKKNKYSEYINQALNDGTDIFIVTAKQISVGVDIDTADQIIWYQVPTDIATIIQAQRRIYRLTSTKSSRIFYLFYKDTNQEDIIQEVSKSAVHNAASYNVRQNDNLAKISKILFPDL